MAEENQVRQEPQQVTKEPQRVQQEPQRITTKDPKKVEAGKRLAAINHKKRETKKREEQAQLEKTTGWGFASRVNQYYGIGAVIAVGVIGGLGYYIYRSKKGQVSREVPNRALQAPTPPQQPWGRKGAYRTLLRGATPGPQGPSCPQTNKFEMD